MKSSSSGTPSNTGGAAANPEEVQKLQAKIDQLSEDYNEEKKQAVKLEEKFDKFKKDKEK